MVTSILENSAIVTFADAHDSYYIKLSYCSVKETVDAIVKALPRSSGRFLSPVGQTTVNFLRTVDLKHSPKLFPTEHLGKELKSANYRILVLRHGLSHEFVVNIIVNGVETKVFNGTMSRFVEWAATGCGIEKFLMKTAQFIYDGGSSPGKVRTIRIEKIDVGEGKTWVEGYDLSRPDLKMAYRRYDAAKIRGDIKVLN